MGFADAVTGRLFLARRRSDLEFQIQAILERKLAILDKSNEISALYANTIFQDGEHSAISSPTALPGTVYPTAVIPSITVGQSDIGSNEYEAELAKLQAIEKELDVEKNKYETELEAVKAEEESLKKIANDHAKKGFKIGG